MDLLKARTKPSFRQLEGVVLGLYTILIGCVIHFHEPWADEAQAWLIARDSSIKDIFLKRLHYEGTPGLWHLLLWTLCRLHLPYASMHWLSAAAGIAAVFILLRYSPLPPLVRAAVPFCFSLVFLTAVIARSYSLVPVLAFAACAVLTGKKDRPILFAVLLGLLANTSAIAFLLALGLAPLYFIWRGNAVVHDRRLIFAGAALVLMLVFAVYTAVPAPDVSYGTGARLVSNPAVGRLVSEITGIPRPSATARVSSGILERQPVDLNAMFLARHSNHRLLSHLLLRTVGYASIAFFPVSRFNALAFLFYVALLWWLAVRRSLVAAIPLLVLILGGRFVGIGEHQVNIVTSALIVALWLGWSRPEPPARRSESLFLIVLLAVLIEQAAWTAHAAVYDIRGPFDPSVAMAQFLVPEVGKARIANLGFESVAVLPYASRDIFFNQRTSYWSWKQGFDPNSYIAQTVAEHPDFIIDRDAITGDTLLSDQIIEQMPPGLSDDLLDKADYLREHGYRETHRFCGWQPAQFGFDRETCGLVYEPVSRKSLY